MVEVDELDGDLAVDLHLASPTTGTLRLMRTPAGILVSGTLSHQMDESCSRCLEPFVRTQVIELNDEFLPVVDVNTGLPLPETGDLDAFRLTPEHLLNLSDAIRQYAILEDPIAPLCKSDCKGLCSRCGANLNLGPCGCRPEPEAEPLEGFGALLAERVRQAGFKPEQE